MSDVYTTTVPKRLFGKTGELVPILGLGTGEGGMGLSDDEAVFLYRSAIEAGITYIDTAPGYDNAQRQLATTLAGIRSTVFLATKAATSNGEDFNQKLEQNLRDLGTDYVDVAYIHSVGNQDIDELLSAKGALHELIRAKERGLARYIGITAHNRADNTRRVLAQHGEIDVAMLAMNFVENHIYGFEESVMPLARSMRLGIAAMKVYGGATDMEYHSPVESAMKARGDHDHRAAFRYSLGIEGVALNVIGVYNTAELEQNIRWACTYTPLTTSERDDLKKLGKKASVDWGERYGSAGQI